MLKHGAEHFAGMPSVHLYTVRMVPVQPGEQWAKVIGPGGVAIDSVAEGQPCRAHLGGLDIAGTVIRHPKPGYLCVATPDSILALFVESAGGSSMQTVQWVLFGGSAERAASARAALETFTAALAGPPPGAEAEAAQTQT